MAELIVIQDSMSDSTLEQHVERKYFIEIPDSNAEVYNQSQIKWSTNQLTSSPDYNSARESEFLIPYSVDLTSSSNLSNGELALTLKNSVMDVVNSMIVKLNGTTVVDASDYSNIYYNWKLANETSKSSLPFLQNKLLFGGINNGELKYNAAASDSGIGESMNIVENLVSHDGNNLSIAPVSAANQVNTAFLTRASMTGFNPASTNNNLYIDAAKCTETRTSHYLSVDAKQKIYHLMITIPLDQFSFFKNMPLTRGSMFNIDLRCHTVSEITFPNTFTAAVSDANVASNTFGKPSIVSTQYGFNPLMIASDSLCKPAADGTISIKTGIGSVNGVVSPFGKKCYLRACMYKFESKFEQVYSSIHKKVFHYENIRMQPFYGVNPNNVNLMISTNQSKLTGVLIQTCLSRTINNLTSPATTTGSGAVSTLESPYTPSLCMKHSNMWTNVNIKLGGRNYYPENLNYSYQFYQDAIKNLLINGGMTPELGSGLVSESDFNNSYGFLYFDFNKLKTDQAEWGLGKSLEFTGRLNTKAALIDINAFYVYENELEINPSTSQLIL